MELLAKLMPVCSSFSWFTITDSMTGLVLSSVVLP